MLFNHRRLFEIAKDLFESRGKKKKKIENKLIDCKYCQRRANASEMREEKIRSCCPSRMLLSKFVFQSEKYIQFIKWANFILRSRRFFSPLENKIQHSFFFYFNDRRFNQ